MEVIKWVKDSYDKVANAYKVSRSGGLLAVKLLPIINKYVPKALDIVLDIGPGNSDNLKVMFEKFRPGTYIGCELSFNMIMSSETPIDWVNCSATHLPIKDSSVDLVLTLAVLHHIPKSLINYVLDGIIRVLKDGGLFITTVWACNDGALRKLMPFNECEGSIPWKYGISEQVNRYYRLYREGELESEVKAVGFKLIESGAVRLGKYLNYYAIASK